MPTFWSQTLIPTARQAPAEAEAPSHRLMLRAGLIRQLGAGLYTYLPAGWRSLQKAAQIIRAEMNAAGAAELFMPALEPMELFADTKRDVDYGDNLFRLKDRHGRAVALAPTHEEVITELMRAYVESYRQLPLNLYQIQTKFRDEYRPRFGVLRSREFIMKDAYSFHLTVEGPGGLNETYERMYEAYCRIFDRCGLTYEIVEAESGPIGGSASHEFMVLCATGEDTILKSDKATPGTPAYAANVEKCAIGERKWTFDGPPTGELETVHTPGMPGIHEVGKFMGVKPRNMLKTLVCKSPIGWVLGVVRGDHELNPGKLKAAIGAPVDLANDAEAREAGFAIGFVAPSVIQSIQVAKMIVDPDAAQAQFWATGADKIDHHVKHFNWRRDVGAAVDSDLVMVADTRNALDGDPAPVDPSGGGGGGTLHAHKGIEVGHVFKLGAKYSDAMGFAVLDENQQKRSVIMGCYGIGLGRILASAIETSHDDDGIIWPASIAPWTVHIVPIRFDGAAKETSLDLAAQLEAAGLDVLIDDRDERPGPKFKDADLLGCPIRITIGDKALAENAVEFTPRAAAGKGELVKLDAVVDRCLEVANGARPAAVV